MFHSHLRITNMQDFATIHSTSYFDVNKKVYQAFDQKPFSSMIDVEEHLHSHPNFLFWDGVSLELRPFWWASFT